MSAVVLPLQAFAAVCVTLVAVVVSIQWRRLRQLPPGPVFTLPLIGETLSLLKDPFTFFYSRYRAYGRIFRTHAMGFPLYVVSEPAVLKSMWFGYDYEFCVPGKSAEILTDGLEFICTSDKHIRWRGEIKQALTRHAMDALLPDIYEVLAKHIDAWRSAGQVQLQPALRGISMDLAMDVLVGLKLPGLDKSWVKSKLLDFTEGMFGMPVNLPGFSLHAALRAKAELSEAVWGDLSVMLASFKKKYEDEASGAVEKTPPKLLEASLRGGGGPEIWTKKQALKLMFQKVMAASDTTWRVMFACIATLERAPDVLAKVVEEQRQLSKPLGPDVTLADLDAMVYLDAVLKETTRLLLPSTPGSFKRTSRDMKVGEWTIPANSVVMAPVHLINSLDPVLAKESPEGPAMELPPYIDWRNNFAGAFKPERWLDPATTPKYYLTFGTGTHMCPAWELAPAEIKLFLALLVRSMTFRLQDPDMLSKCQLFPLMTPKAGTDTLLLSTR